MHNVRFPCICVGEYDGNNFLTYLQQNKWSVSGVETMPTSEGDDDTYSDVTGISRYIVFFIQAIPLYWYEMDRGLAVGYETDPFPEQQKYLKLSTDW